MDTIGSKTPVSSTLADWRHLEPVLAARRLFSAIAALPAGRRRAAIAWLPTEHAVIDEISRARAAHPTGALAGIPYFLKDLFDAAGTPTNAGSTFLSSVRSSRGDAAIVQLLRSRGAVLAGKTQLVEFASGLTGENPHFGDCPHPQFPDRLSGGSSSGSAAMVAAGVVPFAIGTDTGGSVRVPAAFCGLYGFRMTPGDALIADAFPLSPTLDTAGWFTATASDLLETWRELVPSAASTVGTPPLRGCYFSGSLLGADMDATVEAACATRAFGLGARLDLAVARDAVEAWAGSVDAYVTIGMTEAHQVHRRWLEPYRDRYDPLIWRRFRDAGEVSAETIAQAHDRRRQVIEGWHQLWKSYDYVIMPAVPQPAPHQWDCTPALRRNILALTAPASLGGLPCLSLPVALASGLTAGIQVVTREPSSPVFAALLESQLKA